MKKLCCFVLAVLVALMPEAGYAQALPQLLNLPQPGTMVDVSDAFHPAALRGMTIHPENPLQFDFILDSGDSKAEGAAVKEESQRLVNYFLAAMTIPRKDLWVNLSPVEKDRIVPDELIETELGREFLAQDYLLKQFTSSLIYPETALGKEFWSKVYASAQAQLGTTDIPVNTFNKVWITPEKATVYEKGNTVYITQMHLKVQLESDYLANKAAGKDSAAQELSKQVLRDVIIPVIEKEVNEGKNFASIRQSMYSLVLAQWYQDALKDSVLNRSYAGQGKVAGVDVSDPANREKIYQQYMDAYKKGVFNYVKEESQPTANGTAEAMPRKYFSGGVNAAEKVQIDRAKDIKPAQKPSVAKVIRVELTEAAKVSGNVAAGASVVRATIKSSGEVSVISKSLAQRPDAVAGLINKVLLTKAAGVTVKSIRVLQRGMNKKPVDLGEWFEKNLFLFDTKEGTRVTFSDETWVRVSIELPRKVVVSGSASLGLDDPANFLTEFLKSYGLEAGKVEVSTQRTDALEKQVLAAGLKVDPAQALALAGTVIEVINEVLRQDRFRKRDIGVRDGKIREGLLTLKSFLEKHIDQRHSVAYTMGMSATFVMLSAYLLIKVKYGINGEAAALAALVPAMLIMNSGLKGRKEISNIEKRALRAIRRVSFQLSPETDRAYVGILQNAAALLGAPLMDPVKKAEIKKAFGPLLSDLEAGVNLGLYKNMDDLDLQGELDVFKSNSKGSLFVVLESTMQKTVHTKDSLTLANLREHIYEDPTGFYNGFVLPFSQEKGKNADILFNLDTANRPLWLSFVSTIVRGLIADSAMLVPQELRERVLEQVRKHLFDSKLLQSTSAEGTKFIELWSFRKSHTIEGVSHEVVQAVLADLLNFLSTQEQTKVDFTFDYNIMVSDGKSETLQDMKFSLGQRLNDYVDLRRKAAQDEMLPAGDTREVFIKPGQKLVFTVSSKNAVPVKHTVYVDYNADILNGLMHESGDRSNYKKGDSLPGLGTQGGNVYVTVQYVGEGYIAFRNQGLLPAQIKFKIVDASQADDEKAAEPPAGEGQFVADHGVVADDRTQPGGEEGNAPAVDNAGKVEGGIDARDMGVRRDGELMTGVVDNAAIEKMIINSPGLKGVIIDILPVPDFMLLFK